jgi:Flp pilus assembly pilin Flp
MRTEQNVNACLVPANPRIGSESRMRLLRRLLESRSGAAAAEFAIILPAFTAMLLGTIQYGTLMFTYNGMMDTARSSARDLAVGISTPAQVESKGKGKKLGWIKNDKWAVTAMDTAATGTNEVRMEIRVPSKEATVLPFLPMPEELVVTVSMEKEA